MCQNTNLPNLHRSLFSCLELENLGITFLSDDNHHDDCFDLEQRLVLFASILKVHFQKCLKKQQLIIWKKLPLLIRVNPCHSWSTRRTFSNSPILDFD